jgi:seryl-tRNA synthetase
MLNTKYVKDHLQEIRKSLEKRKSDYPLDELLEVDEEAKKINLEIQKLREDRNRGSAAIAAEAKAGKKPEKGKVERLAAVKEKIAELEAKAKEYDENVDKLLWNMPNILHESVPYGKSDDDNQVVRKEGAPVPRKEPSHDETLVKMGMLEMEQAAEVSGARFYYLKGEMVLLEQALIRFSIDLLYRKGFVPVSPPFMLKRKYYKGATALGDFEEALYGVVDEKGMESDEDLFMISTSEHPIAAMHAGKIFSAKDLPMKYAGISPCFRREAGSHGKDTKGIFRVHQFYKVEQFAVTKEEDSWEMLDELLGNVEEIFKKLGIPYRIVNICTGDIGVVAAKKYDLEAYMPAQDRYREMASCSNCTDWQSIRLGIRYDEANERKYAHTLNCTALATTRTMVAIIENYMNEDGSIGIPSALQPYMGGKKRIG